MIKKELFVQTINFIKERNDSMSKLNEVFVDEFEDSAFYPYFKYEDQLIKVLASSFEYDDGIIEDWISYYCFELDFGRRHKLGDVAFDGVPIPLGTPEELYDMLFKEACGHGIAS
jgi:hypothetical protein